MRLAPLSRRYASRARFARPVLFFAALAVASALWTADSALADDTPSPWWDVGVEVAPTNLPPEGEGEPGHTGEGEVIVFADNLGDAPAIASALSPVTVSDLLPEGITATASAGRPSGAQCSIAEAGRHVECTFTADTLNPYERLQVTIKVKVGLPPGTHTTLPDKISAQGAGATPSSTIRQLTISGAPTAFGIEPQGYRLEPLEATGMPDVQSGSHPFALTTTLVLNQTVRGPERRPVALPMDLRFNLSAGIVGDASAAEQCPIVDFFAHDESSDTDACPAGSAIGVANAMIDEPETGLQEFDYTVPIFNLEPAPGEPARFGFDVSGKFPVVIDTTVRTGSDYGVTATVEATTELAWLLSSQVTLWGDPGDSRHDDSRGWECAGSSIEHRHGEPCPAANTGDAFLTLPTMCPANPIEDPLVTSMEADSWAQPAQFPLPEPSAEYTWTNEAGQLLGFDGCPKLPFTPTIQASTGERTGSTPTSLTLTVKLPQTSTLDPKGLAEADIRDTRITLPQGLQINPSGANGLEACSEQQAGFTGPGAQQFTPAAPSCPASAKVANVHVRTPLLPHELEGSLYVAEPAPKGEEARNPFDSLLAFYLVAEDKEAGVLVKLAGEGKLDPTTGRISTTFNNTPQLPFEELKVELFGGRRAPLSTAAFCGTYQTAASFTPWSETPALTASSPTSESAITEDCTNSAPLALAPAFDAESTNPQAGAFSPFIVQIERPDGQQALSGVSVSLPSGVAALIATLTPCQEPPPGVEWSCGEASLVGHSVAWSGLGSEPVVLPGDVYLTSGYDGAPFGLLVRTKAQAGPFDLGYVDVRSRIDVNRQSAAVTITTDPGPRGEGLPTMLKGIPVQLKRLQVTIDRPGFEFNPTSCEPMAVQGTLEGSEGASAPVSSRFQVGGCASLPFDPTLTATVDGHASKADGTGLTVNITSAGLGQANIRKVDLQLPEALPSRNSTLNKACLAAVFEANPAGCSEESVIGYATVHTPILKSPLTGPAYLVSHGGAAFPDVEFVLQGEGVEIVLDGKTQIKKEPDGAEVTYSKFESAPDAPFTSFETVLPAGPHSILGAYASAKKPYDLCSAKLLMPTTITAQDGDVITRNTSITPTGCSGVLASTTKLTKAQLLAKALKACRKDKEKTRRLACEKAARKRYAAKAWRHKSEAKASKRAHPR